MADVTTGILESQRRTVSDSLPSSELISLGEAAKHSPGRPSANCVWRWCRKGVRARCGQRVRLRHVRVGGKIFTSARWVDEFGQQVAEADAAYFANCDDMKPQPTRPPAARSDHEREASIARAEKLFAANSK